MSTQSDEGTLAGGTLAVLLVAKRARRRDSPDKVPTGTRW
jgi:hypothetical protein